jgi:hypothetical protein
MNALSSFAERAMASSLLRAYPLPGILLGPLLLVTSCASTGEIKIPIEKYEQATEKLLLLPIQQGHAGVDQVVRHLQRHYGVDAATRLSTLTNAGQPIALEDGTVITQALTGTRTHAPDWDEVAFDLKARPCLRIERALALTGATRMGESAGSDTVLAGVTYRFQNSHIRMDITTYALNPQCVGTVWIYKVRSPKPV